MSKEPKKKVDPIMKVKSINKSIRSSTRKMKPILRGIVGKKVEYAIRDLSFSDKRVSKDIKNLFCNKISRMTKIILQSK